ncbi:DUF7525 family protein [Halanaeroarchaeum sulfurireducens]|uniref:DUF7525 family protein n=1 Tax=Halanaeroarchaeum sulfurireducens TaxID=1604004 RepID=UPI00067885BE|nr:hypothetical protein [Halanaeroarchaeum sulfurireducens]
MSTTTSNSATDLDTGIGILFGLLAAVSAGILYIDGVLGGLGYGAAVVFGALLMVSLHVYH